MVITKSFAGRLMASGFDLFLLLNGYNITGSIVTGCCKPVAPNSNSSSDGCEAERNESKQCC
jgi:hypothetical protein